MPELVFPALSRAANKLLTQQASALPLEQLGSGLGLAGGSSDWFRKVLDGRFQFLDLQSQTHVALWSWSQPFPPPGETIVTLDLEATNGDPSKEEIIEIGAVKLAPNGDRHEFSKFNRPNRPISPYVQGLTGIRPEMLRDAPPLEQSLLELLDFVGDATLVIQNAEFDLAFLTPLFGKLGRKLRNPVVDTLNLARRALPGRRKRGLDALGWVYDIEAKARHRALGDARTTLEVAQALYFVLSGGKQNTLAQLHENVLRPMGRAAILNPSSPSSGPSSTATTARRRDLQKPSKVPS